MYKNKIETCTLLLRKVILNFKKEFDKEMEKGKGKMAKALFGLTLDGVKDDKDSTKRKALSSRKGVRVIILL